MSVAAVDSSIAARMAHIQSLQARVLGHTAATGAAPAATPSVTSTSAAPAAGTFAAALQGAQGTQPPGLALTRSASAGGASALAGVPSGSAAAAGLPYGAEIDAAAQAEGIPPLLLAGLVRQESNFDPRARSSAGASGLTQLMPATAAGLGVSDPTDPAQALRGGARYLREQLNRFGSDPELALAAYNAGPGAVQRFGGVPPYPETQAYVRRIMAGLAGTS